MRLSLGPVRMVPVLWKQGRAVISSLRSGETSLDAPKPSLPPGRLLELGARGSVFYRDTGARRAARGTVLLLHGWMVPTDPHWFQTFSQLADRGWRVVALDARGHGRGLRPAEAFELKDCAADTAALIDHLGCGPVTVVGYSMGGLIAQLLAYRHAEVVSGVVLAATAAEFRTSPILRVVWSGMGLFQLWLQLAPRWTWDVAVRSAVRGDLQTTGWMVGELRRGAPWDIADAGREIGRFDSREWVGKLVQPTVSLVTTMDFLVPDARQRDLARRVGAPIVEVRSDHLAPATTPRRFHRGLIRALELVALEEAARLPVSREVGAGRAG